MNYGSIIIYKDKNGLNNIEVKMVDNNVWLNQEQLVNLYNSSKLNISEHMIVAIGFRVKSNIGTNFRIWANERLTVYIQKGFTMNDDLLKRVVGGAYFDELLSRIRDIRSSEKVFLRKILDILCNIY